MRVLLLVLLCHVLVACQVSDSITNKETIPSGNTGFLGIDAYLLFTDNSFKGQCDSQGSKFSQVEAEFNFEFELVTYKNVGCDGEGHLNNNIVAAEEILLTTSFFELVKEIPTTIFNEVHEIFYDSLVGIQTIVFCRQKNALDDTYLHIYQESNEHFTIMKIKLESIYTYPIVTKERASYAADLIDGDKLTFLTASDQIMSLDHNGTVINLETGKEYYECDSEKVILLHKPDLGQIKAPHDSANGPKLIGLPPIGL